MLRHPPLSCLAGMFDLTNTSFTFLPQ
jgi:hypothetical protein